MRFLKTLGATAALFAVAAIVIFALPQSGETASWAPEGQQLVNASHNDDLVYVPGGATMTINNLPEPNAECVSNRRYDVRVKRSWIGISPIEASHDRVVQIGDDPWPTTIDINGLDTGGTYRFNVRAKCTIPGGKTREAFQNYSNFRTDTVPAYEHHGGWAYAYMNGDNMDVHVQPSSACDGGYRLRHKIGGGDWTTSTHQHQPAGSMAATPASDLHDEFIVFTVPNENYKRVQVHCLTSNTNSQGNIAYGYMDHDNNITE